ncbi:response regulator transcription factor [Methylobacterium sp. NEAU 140]|uniref:response regulator transcription factor n=1 Tax=Methylobacterium sp. NEAU 140 TaxID=3064945 RepID=UPI0027331D04|nr:response regulator transcription factor [Methylobacterium sp. NEAU 140]MDP4021381.1 response regulator transcription factor [Methylobacterium sp. NEAU 140]
MIAAGNRAERATRPPPALRDGLLIVDDHPVVLQGFRRLAEEAGIARVHEAADIVSGYRTFHRHRPGLVVTDLSFGADGLSGLSLIRRIRALDPVARILAFSMHDDPVIAARVLESGALGFVLKDSSVAAFLEALDAVRAGRSYLPHAIATGIATLDLTPRRSPLARLTARELQILSLLGKGRSYSDIAGILTLNYRSVVSATSAIRLKLGAGSLAELMHIALTQDGALR